MASNQASGGAAGRRSAPPEDTPTQARREGRSQLHQLPPPKPRYVPLVERERDIPFLPPQTGRRGRCGRCRAFESIETGQPHAA
eukprot:scaffold70120_cov35-Tisochrysis_lutea.AAC.1